ncbi:CoxG family protein [Phosphitispora sp. TUW77]|uniref:CoxG family protein n=1 Tax=Phosphitispora sp. TUW77 TaxID=3152361 RepID=UPI003AB2DF1A
MPEIKRETVVPLAISNVWPFIADYNNWAHDMPGYEKHDTISDKESVWHVTGHVGPINKTVPMRVLITEWVNETKVAFTIDAEGLPVSGNGSVNIRENGPEETRMTFKLFINCTGMIGNLVNAQLAKMLPKMCDGFIKDLAKDIMINNKKTKEA